MGAAHGYQFPEKGPLRAADFSVGDATVKAKLEQLGFAVESTAADMSPVSRPQYTSTSLQIGAVYTREQLRELFEITTPRVSGGLKGSHSGRFGVAQLRSSRSQAHLGAGRLNAKNKQSSGRPFSPL